MDLSKFKPIVLVSKNHLINESGDIYSIPTKRLMTHQIKNGCHSVTLNKNTYYIHRLVMMTFQPIKKYRTMYVNHKDKNRSNNHVSNLEWCTQKENLDWNKVNSTLSFLTYVPPERNLSDLLNEKWYPLKESKDYMISNMCRVKSLSRLIRQKNGQVKRTKDIILSPRKYPNEYLFVSIVENRVSKAYMIHRLMATNFIPNPENKPCVNHKNGIKTDNRVENLEWCTKSENMIHAVDVLKTGRHGESSPTGKYTEKQVRNLFKFHKEGYSKKEAGRKAGINPNGVYEILNRTTWKHLQIN